jgi:hypothetical protein
MRIGAGLGVVGSSAVLLLSGCSRSNNVLLGRVEAAVGGHTVVVTDCYRTAVPQPRKEEGSPGVPPAFRFTPCRDADVLIRGEELIVNGASYGHLKPGEDVIVDHGIVVVGHRAPTRDDSSRRRSPGGRT